MDTKKDREEENVCNNNNQMDRCGKKWRGSKKSHENIKESRELLKYIFI